MEKEQTPVPEKCVDYKFCHQNGFDGIYERCDKSIKGDPSLCGINHPQILKKYAKSDSTQTQ